MKEKRSSPRFEGIDTVRITVVDASDESGLCGQTFVCNGKDISAEGLCFSSSMSVVSGAILRITVDFCTPRRCISNMVARIAWVRKSAQDRHLIGIDVSGSSAECLEAWRDVLERRAAAGMGICG